MKEEGEIRVVYEGRRGDKGDRGFQWKNNGK